MASANGADPAADKKSSAATIPKGKKELKILMLHGYTQSGPLFSAKTKALNKLLIKALGPVNLHPTLIFPSGPHRLKPSDIPGYTPPDDGQFDDGGDDDLDNWSWFRKDDATGEYRGIESGMERVASTISEAGGIDGIIGFSQGGCMAALVAAALETGPHRHNPPSSPSSSPGQNLPSWLTALRTANNNRPAKFAVIYSGFHATPQSLQWLYDPPVSTPTMHFLGGLDTVVEEKRSVALVERCRDPVVLTHPGGHYVPVAKDWVMPVAGWLRERCTAGEETGSGEKGVKNSL